MSKSENRFIHENFLLQNKTAQRLYHEYAADLPIIDYHCHLSPHDIAANKQFSNIYEAWLSGDHYKWRAMRTLGVDEKFITGNSSDLEKFQKWAETVPYTLRNPLYHWTHLELVRYFGIHDLLGPQNADQIYEATSTQLRQPENKIQGLLNRMNVETVCSTDDPIDGLESHRLAKHNRISVNLLPCWRPDKLYAFSNPTAYNRYLDTLSEVAGGEIRTLNQLFDAIRLRMDFFEANGCTLSDHGLNQMPVLTMSEADAKTHFSKIRNGGTLSPDEQDGLAGYILYYMCNLYHEKKWVQQFHLGASRNNSVRQFEKIGPDTGFDSIGDFSQSSRLVSFLGKLESGDKLTKTILYNLNPSDNEVFASIAGSFNDGTSKGKIQHGSAWWFLDQKDGIEKQLNSLSNIGLLSCFVGMLTDSRSFLSFPRHEYFRRVLCNIMGNDIENGLLPGDLNWTGKIVSDISYFNARDYFNFPEAG